MRSTLPAAAAVALVLGVGAAVALTLSNGSSGSADPTRAKTPAVAPRIPRGALVARIGGRPVGRPVPSGFVGFSFEFQAVRDYTGTDPAAINPVLVQLIRNLNPNQSPVLRIGGDSTDLSYPSGAQPPRYTGYELTPGWMATTGALARAVNARM